jgi:hypothetical protein
MAQDDGNILTEISSILGSMGTGQPQGSQTVWPVRFVNAPGTNVPVIGYTGPGLVGFSNNVEEDNYQVTDGLIRDVYSSLMGDSRANTLAILKQKGFYGNRPIGVPENDLEAIQQWLEESNLAGVTKERYLQEMLKNRPDYGGTGGGAPRRYRVSNPDDLKAVFKRVAQETIGRDFSDDEAMRAVQSYQQQEIAAQNALYAGGTATEVMGADVFAQQFAQQVAPTEANGYKFLDSINMIFRATGGR